MSKKKLKAKTVLTNAVNPKTGENRTKTVLDKTNLSQKDFPVFELVNTDKRVFKQMCRALNVTGKRLRKLIKSDSEIKETYNSLRAELIGE